MQPNYYHQRGMLRHSHNNPYYPHKLMLQDIEIKVINPDKRSENRLFTFRNVDCDKLSSPVDLNKIIFDQLGQNLVSKDLTFDVGYYRGNKRVNILSSDDMQDMRKLVRNKDSSGVSSCTLWCMGLSAKKDVDSGKRTRDQTDSESDTDSDPGTKRRKRRKKSTKKSRHEEKLERIDNIIGKLKTKHGSIFSIVYGLNHLILATTRDWTHPLKVPYSKLKEENLNRIHPVQHLILHLQLETHPMIQS